MSVDVPAWFVIYVLQFPKMLWLKFFKTQTLGPEVDIYPVYDSTMYSKTDGPFFVVRKFLKFCILVTFWPPKLKKGIYLKLLHAVISLCYLLIVVLYKELCLKKQSLLCFQIYLTVLAWCRQEYIESVLNHMLNHKLLEYTFCKMKFNRNLSTVFDLDATAGFSLP